MLDRKEMALIHSLTERIASGTFDELDTSSFWLHLREPASHIEVIREFGDFVAHRSRERGRVFNYLQDATRNMEFYNSGRPSKIDLNYAFSSDEMIEGVEASLKELGLEPLGELQTGALLTATFFLLQDVRIRYRRGDLIAVLQPSVGPVTCRHSSDQW